MGSVGCQHIVAAIDTGVRAAPPGDRAVALRRRPARRGRRGAGRGGPDVRRDGARLRPGAADLGRARRGGRRRRLRPGAHRPGRDGPGGPGVRHRPGRGAQRHRRDDRHGGPRRAERARQAVRCGARGGRLRGRRAAPGPAADRACSPGPGSSTCGPSEAKDPDLRALLPAEKRRAYDVRPLVRGLLDDDPDDPSGCAFEELQAEVGAEHRGRARPARRAQRRRAGQQPAAPRWLPGLPLARRRRPDSCGCATRSGSRCWCSWTCPGTCREWARSGTAWCGAARSCCTLSPRRWCPRVTLVTRKAFGGAYVAMNSRSLGATAVFAWPEAEVAVMGAKAAVGILHRRKLAAARRRRAGRAARPARRGAREDRRRGQPGDGDRRGRRGDRTGRHPAPARRGARRRTRRPRRPRQHPALTRSNPAHPDRLVAGFSNDKSPEAGWFPTTSPPWSDLRRGAAPVPVDEQASSAPQRADVTECGAEAIAFDLQVEAALQVQPEPLRCAEVDERGGVRCPQ